MMGAAETGPSDAPGERGVLSVSASEILRLRYNPFYSFLEERASSLSWTTNLGDLLAKERVLVASWRAGMKSDFRLVLDAQRFDLEPDGAVLDATWALLGESENLTKKSS
jgi:hypothetical protein